MKANFKLISTLLIVLLTILLVAVLVAYYNKPIEINNESIKNVASTNHGIDKVISESVSGEMLANGNEIAGGISGEDNTKSETSTKSGDIVSVSIPEISLNTNQNSETSSDKDKTVIITSEDTMTNKEKRQILTELDNALMELLDVVDKVQTVDETRLATSGSEVQE